MPVIVSFVASAILLSLVPSSSALNNFDVASIINRTGGVEGAVAAVRNIPQDVRIMKMMKNGIPHNDDRVGIPTRKLGSEELSLAATSGIALDIETGLPLWDKKSQVVRPIASITKLMTALVFLENNPGWDNIYEVKREDRRDGGRVYIFPGEKIKLRDLFYLSLVGSANTATMALVNATGMSEAEFVAKMNAKARALGLSKTSFVDPVGLSSLNVSTAFEVAQLAQASLAQDDIRTATLQAEYSFKTEALGDKSVQSTDKLLKIFPNNGIKMIGGKTGYIEAAGFCFVGQFANEAGRQIISVILGSDSVDNRFIETNNLVEWVFDSYDF